MMSKLNKKGLDGMSNPFLSELDWNDSELLNMYSLLSANLTNFLPILDIGEHRAFYDKFRYQQLLNGNDIKMFEGKYPLPIDGWDSLSSQIRKCNGVIATYHFGPFQLINYLLIREGIPYALLVAGQIKEEWDVRYPGLLTHLDKAAKKGTFHLLDANDPSSLRRLYMLLDNGFNLLIYVDGIEGLHEQIASKMTKINFLGQEIHIPKGTATLAHRFKIPIYPCLLLRYDDRITIEISNAITVDDAQNKQTHAQLVSDRLFAFLAKYVMHWPEQWTNWPMLHRFLLHNMPIGTACITQDNFEKLYGLLTMHNEQYLLEKRSYKLFPLDDADFNTLKNNWF